MDYMVVIVWKRQILLQLVFKKQELYILFALQARQDIPLFQILPLL